MLLFLLTTGRCNLRCEYCGGSFPEDLVPWSVRYSLDDLSSFVEGCEDLTVAFYGGEPLLNPRMIRDVMNTIPARRFVIQTNGLLVKSLPPDCWRRFDAVLLSIDGVEEVTDSYRGEGVYRRVLEAARWLRSVGFSGDLIARMAVSEWGDIYRDVTHLLSLGVFDRVHWQLDVMWSDRWRDFDGWAWNSYVPGVRRLVGLWLEEATRGNVLGMVPVLGLLKNAIFDEYTIPPCGAGHDAFAVSTDGRVLACPIAVAEEWAELGHVGELRLPYCADSVRIGEPCTSCDIFRYCGGRCLYAHMERTWGEEGFRKVCAITREFVNEVLQIVPEVKKLLRRGIIGEDELRYPPFNNSTEIIP